MLDKCQILSIHFSFWFILSFFRCFTVYFYTVIQIGHLSWRLGNNPKNGRCFVCFLNSWSIITSLEHLDILSLSIFGLMLKTWNYTTRFSFVGLIAFDMSREWPRRLSVITLSLFEKLIREQNTIRDSSFFRVFSKLCTVQD